MIDLSKVKVAVFDFDDTLCVHRHHSFHKSISNYNELAAQGIYPWDQLDSYGNTFCVKSLAMQVFINMLRSNSVRMYVCSATSLLNKGELKVRWATKEYDYNFGNLNVEESVEKVPAILDLTKILKCDPGEVLIVDDYYYVTDAAADAGCQSASTIEVIEYIVDHSRIR